VSLEISKCHNQAKRSKSQKIEEIERIIGDNTKTDQEIAEILGISRRTVLRVRKALGQIKQRGGTRLGAGRPMGSENTDRYPPAEILPAAKLRICNEDFYARWAGSGFRQETTSKNGTTQYTPKPETTGKGWTYKPPLYRKQLF